LNTIPRTPLIRAPADEQIGVAPFFDSSKPLCRSSLLGASSRNTSVGTFEPPLSGRPMPPNHAAVTIRLPAGYPVPQSPGLPTKANGTAWTEPSGLEKSSAGAEDVPLGFVGVSVRSHATPRHKTAGYIRT